MATAQDLQDSGYARTGRLLYRVVQRLNDAGRYFPLWATCLGMELLFEVERPGIRFTRSEEIEVARPLEFRLPWQQLRLESRLFRDLREQEYEVRELIFTENSGINSFLLLHRSSSAKSHSSITTTTGASVQRRLRRRSWSRSSE